MSELIRKQDAIDAIQKLNIPEDMCVFEIMSHIEVEIATLPSAQPEIIYCKDCKYGEQDEIGRWYCRGLGCQIGDDDGNGFCSDAERRE